MYKDFFKKLICLFLSLQMAITPLTGFKSLATLIGSLSSLWALNAFAQELEGSVSPLSIKSATRDVFFDSWRDFGGWDKAGDEIKSAFAEKEGEASAERALQEKVLENLRDNHGSTNKIEEVIYTENQRLKDGGSMGLSVKDDVFGLYRSGKIPNLKGDVIFSSKDELMKSTDIDLATIYEDCDSQVTVTPIFSTVDQPKETRMCYDLVEIEFNEAPCKRLKRPKNFRKIGSKTVMTSNSCFQNQNHAIKVYEPDVRAVKESFGCVYGEQCWSNYSYSALGSFDFENGKFSNPSERYNSYEYINISWQYDPSSNPKYKPVVTAVKKISTPISSVSTGLTNHTYYSQPFTERQSCTAIIGSSTDAGTQIPLSVCWKDGYARYDWDFFNRTGPNLPSNCTISWGSHDIIMPDGMGAVAIGNPTVSCDVPSPDYERNAGRIYEKQGGYFRGSNSSSGSFAGNYTFTPITDKDIEKYGAIITPTERIYNRGNYFSGDNKNMDTFIGSGDYLVVPRVEPGFKHTSSAVVEIRQFPQQSNDWIFEFNVKNSKNLTGPVGTNEHAVSLPRSSDCPMPTGYLPQGWVNYANSMRGICFQEGGSDCEYDPEKLFNSMTSPVYNSIVSKNSNRIYDEATWAANHEATGRMVFPNYRPQVFSVGYHNLSVVVDIYEIEYEEYDEPYGCSQEPGCYTDNGWQCTNWVTDYYPNRHQGVSFSYCSVQEAADWTCPNGWFTAAPEIICLSTSASGDKECFEYNDFVDYVNANKLTSCASVTSEGGCQWARSECIDGFYDDYRDSCFGTEHTYLCGGGSQPVQTGVTRTTITTCPNTGECSNPDDCSLFMNEKNEDFKKAVSALSLADLSALHGDCGVEIAEGLTRPPETEEEMLTCQLFKGNRGTCKRHPFNHNCCKNPGNGASPVQMMILIYKSWDLAKKQNLLGKIVDWVSGPGSWADWSESLNATWSSIKEPFVNAWDGIMKAFGFGGGGGEALDLAGQISSIVDSAPMPGSELAGKFFEKIQQTVLEGLADFAEQIGGQAFRDSLFSEVGGKTTLGGKGAWLGNAIVYVYYAYLTYVVINLVLDILYECTKDETQLAFKKSGGLCYHVSTSKKKNFLGLSTYTETHCCYASPFARIVMQQAMKQPQFKHKPEGSCPGLTVEELSQMDWEAIDLTDWVNLLIAADIIPTPDDFDGKYRQRSDHSCMDFSYADANADFPAINESGKGIEGCDCERGEICVERPTKENPSAKSCMLFNDFVSSNQQLDELNCAFYRTDNTCTLKKGPVCVSQYLDTTASRCYAMESEYECVKETILKSTWETATDEEMFNKVTGGSITKPDGYGNVLERTREKMDLIDEENIKNLIEKNADDTFKGAAQPSTQP